MPQRRFSLNWKIGLFTLFFFPLMVSLGFWQLDREDQKRELQSTWEARIGQSPLTLEDVQQMSDPAFMPVGLEGRYDVAHSFLLDNKINQGRVGYELITPLKNSAGQTVLINRGWLPQGSSRQNLPALESLPGHHILVANVHVPDGELMMLGEESGFAGWPRLMQQPDVERMYDELGIASEDQGLPYILRLQEGMPGALVWNWPPLNTMPAKHRGYAVQWFSMATVLLLLFIYSCFPKVAVRDSQHKER